MSLVVLIATLALIQFIVFSMLVGRARMKYGVKAPAMTGHPIFERYIRVQMNTLEQLAVFLPALFMFYTMAESRGWYSYQIASVCGLVWLIGRTLYARSYVQDPDRRGVGFLMTFAPSAVMIIGTLVAVFASLA